MIPVLFTLPQSIYDDLGCNTYNKERNALHYSGEEAIIAHPPCRSWSRLRKFARPEPGERWLAVWAALQINRKGGILEHPAGSALWKAIGLPLPGLKSCFNGFTISVNQRWFGHPCDKKTLLYINGCTPADLPEIPLCFDATEYAVGLDSRTLKRYKSFGKKEAPKEWRKKTPEAFAKWLIQVQQIIEYKKLSNETNFYTVAGTPQSVALAARQQASAY